MGFEVLRAFDSNSTNMSLRDLEIKTGINKATVRKFALTLVDLGYLNLLPDNKFELSLRVLALGANYLESLNLPDLALPVPEYIAGKVKESTNMAILDGPEVVYVLRVNAAERIIGANLRVESRLPLLCNLFGESACPLAPKNGQKKIWDSATIEAFTNKTITTYEEFEAHLATCRSQGYTESNDELEVGLRSIAMPVFN
ncbi:IclR family transcriptional regulator domain-containing protein [Paenisporosarcina indica]|uniref:IclR family transcriptional regulator domain-containing protein n=1 Tax=Paenisporosarcina indica TaxID=650093 RepID=UPI00095025CE|nr:IclR family transcriptional regulator C-terminal domain-containing protein [Paenisporosarcina indica]